MSSKENSIKDRAEWLGQFAGNSEYHFYEEDPAAQPDDYIAGTKAAARRLRKMFGVENIDYTLFAMLLSELAFQEGVALRDDNFRNNIRPKLYAGATKLSTALDLYFKHPYNINSVTIECVEDAPFEINSDSTAFMEVKELKNKKGVKLKIDGELAMKILFCALKDKSDELAGLVAEGDERMAVPGLKKKPTEKRVIKHRLRNQAKVVEKFLQRQKPGFTKPEVARIVCSSLCFVGLIADYDIETDGYNDAQDYYRKYGASLLK
jgi:hypothetical protein